MKEGGSETLGTLCEGIRGRGGVEDGRKEEHWDTLLKMS